MGFRDFIRGITRPDPDVLPVDPEELRVRLLRLNQPEAAWQVRDGAQEKRVDVVAEWKTTDPYWQPIFEEVRLNKTFATHLRFRPGRNEVRSRDRCYRWDSMTYSDGSGISGMAWVDGQLHMTAEGTVNGQHYRFDTQDFKDVLKKTVTDAGWTYRAIVLRRL